MRGTLSFTPAAISTLVGLLLSNPVTPSDSSIVDARPWLCNQEALQVADIARAYAAAGDIDHALVYQRRADAGARAATECLRGDRLGAAEAGFRPGGS